MSGSARERNHPAYPLDEVHGAFACGRFKVTRRVARHLTRRGWGAETVCRCIGRLNTEDFYKSQEHLGVPGVWLDIYKPFMGRERLYVKFLRMEEGDVFRVLSFCSDGEPH